MIVHKFGMVRLGPDHYGLESFVAKDGKKKDITFKFKLASKEPLPKPEPKKIN